MWTKERAQLLLDTVGTERPVSQDTVTSAAEVLEVSPRSISAKLRKMGEKVELASARARKFSDAQAESLIEFVSANAGDLTYAEIAEEWGDGNFSSKQVQGKLLSLELTSSVKAAPKVESKKTYTDEEEATFIVMAEAGKFLEEIASALNKSLASVRGKALSLNRTQQLPIPKQKESHANVAADPIDELGSKLLEMTVDEIVAVTGKSIRGVKTIISRRNLECADYKAKKKKPA